MSAIVLRGDARQLLLPDESVDLIVTSPPYWALRSYADGGEHYADQIGAEATPGEYIAALVDCTREWVRVLKPAGSIFVNLGDKYAQTTERSRNGEGARKTTQAGGLTGAKSYLGGTVRLASRDNGSTPRKSLMLLPERYRIACLDQLGLIVRAVIVWDKPNGLPESVRDRVRRSHEDWVHLTKSPQYFAAVDEIREAHVYGPGRGGAPSGAYSAGSGRNDSGTHTSGGFATLNPLGRLPGSVWRIATQPLRVPSELGVNHFAAFPMAWPRRLILGWSPAGGTVLDPFGGTGTTALVASALGRVGISIDLSADYCQLAAWRTTDPKQRARAAGVEKMSKQSAKEEH